MLPYLNRNDNSEKGTKMKAIVWTKYGQPDVLQLKEVEKPSPKDDEVLVRVHASTVTAGDCEMRSLKFPLHLALTLRVYNGVRKPTRVTILGQEMAGEVESVGRDVKRFREGDQVFAATGFPLGGYAEYACLPEQGAIALKPSNLTYEEAAVVPVGGLNALHFLRHGNIQSGERVLINGAGGSIGTIGVQLAKSYGADVTAVDSAGKLDMLRGIGADHVVDYTLEDFTKNGESYDVIFDVVGKAPFQGSIRSLEEYGVYLLGNPSLLRSARGWWTSITGGRKVIGGTAEYRVEDLNYLRELIEAGKIKPVIDRRYPLEQTAEAHRYVETGRKKGNVVITVEH